jgi:hypothetical protein
MTLRKVAGCRFDSGFDFTVTYPAVWGPHLGKVVEHSFPYARLDQ